MSVPIHAFDTVPIRSDLRANRDSGDVILDADGEYFSFKTKFQVVFFLAITKKLNKQKT